MNWQSTLGSMQSFAATCLNGCLLHTSSHMWVMTALRLTWARPSGREIPLNRPRVVTSYCVPESELHRRKHRTFTFQNFPLFSHLRKKSKIFKDQICIIHRVTRKTRNGGKRESKCSEAWMWLGNRKQNDPPIELITGVRCAPLQEDRAINYTSKDHSRLAA